MISLMYHFETLMTGHVLDLTWANVVSLDCEIEIRGGKKAAYFLSGWSHLPQILCSERGTARW